ncbi:MAG: type II toxin-antitoxin system VapB family antitoxin [Deltaproteobacteria bacterium]|nr:type II toxin-antitoxin system VapB family antitoxin [Deltaproteobacteria bacterium]
MRTTLNLKEDLYQKASRATGIKEKTKLIHLGLEALLREEALKHLASLYGQIPKVKAIKRKPSSL